MNEATIAKKQEEVLAVVNKINGASSTLFVDYLGLTVEKFQNFVLSYMLKTVK